MIILRIKWRRSLPKCTSFSGQRNEKKCTAIIFFFFLKKKCCPSCFYCSPTCLFILYLWIHTSINHFYYSKFLYWIQKFCDKYKVPLRHQASLLWFCYSSFLSQTEYFSSLYAYKSFARLSNWGLLLIYANY